MRSFQLPVFCGLRVGQMPNRCAGTERRAPVTEEHKSPRTLLGVKWVTELLHPQLPAAIPPTHIRIHCCSF